MKKRIFALYKHPLISGSMVIFLGSILSGFLNFLFNLFMSRNLSLPDYGTLVSFISLMTLVTLPAGSITPTIVNFAASYFARNKLSMVRSLFIKLGKASFLTGIAIIVILMLLKENINLFFNIYDDFLILLLGIAIFISFIGVVNYALLQAKLSFNFISFINFLSSLLKLILGIILVFSGFTVYGAMASIIFSSLIPYLISFIPLRFIFLKNTSTHNLKIKTLFSYGTPAAIVLIGMSSLINADIILVKHFFNPTEAGLYAGLSLVGKVIFFFSAPISSVMFPLIVQKHTKNESYHSIFRLSLLLIFGFSVAISLFYFLFPAFVINFFLKREAYLVIAPYLVYFAIFITIYSLISVLTYYFLSIKKTNIYIPITLTALAQIILIYFFHDTFLHVISISIAVSTLLLVGFLLYYQKLSPLSWGNTIFGKKMKV